MDLKKWYTIEMWTLFILFLQVGKPSYFVLKGNVLTI
jgi:hypothetical protein